MKKLNTPAAARMNREIAALKKKPDSEINFRDIPRQDLDSDQWKNGVVGKYFRPIKEPIALRLDADIIAWFKAQGKGYQTRINEILRSEMVKRVSRP